VNVHTMGNEPARGESAIQHVVENLVRIPVSPYAHQWLYGHTRHVLFFFELIY